MALIRPIPSGTETPDNMNITVTLQVAVGLATYQAFLTLSSDEITALNNMGYNYVTTPSVAKQTLTTNSVLIAGVGSSNVTATITFSKE